MDQNIFNSQKKVELLFTIFDEKIFISLNGLSFNDIIYSQNFDSTLTNVTLGVPNEYFEGVGDLALKSHKITEEQERDYLTE